LPQGPFIQVRKKEQGKRGGKMSAKNYSIDEYRATLRELVEGDAHLDEYFYCGHCDREVGQGYVHAKDCPVVRARLMLGALSVEMAQQLDWPACEQDALDLAEPQEARDTADDTIALDEFCQYIDRRRKS
jgi:hypothetical protein